MSLIHLHLVVFIGSAAGQQIYYAQNEDRLTLKSMCRESSLYAREAELESYLNQIKAGMDRFEEQNNAVLEKLSRIEKDMTDSNEMINSSVKMLEQNVNNSIERNHGVNYKLNRLESELNNSKEKLNVLEQLLDNSNEIVYTKVTKLEQELGISNERNRMVENKIEQHLKNSSEINQALKKKMNKLEQESNTSRDVVEEKLNMLEQGLNDSDEIVHTKLTKLEQELDISNERNRMVEKKIDRLEQDLKNSSEINQALEKKMNELEQELNTSRGRYEVAEENISRFEHGYNQSKELFKTIEGKTVRYEGMLNDFTENKKVVGAKIKELEQGLIQLIAMEFQNKCLDKKHKYYAGDVPTDQYCFIESIMTWNASKTKCQSLDSHLVEITTKEEQDWLNEKVLSRSWWTGGLHDESDNIWLWSHSHQNFTFKNWGPNQPNSLHEDCVLLQVDDRMWHDYPCSWKFSFICEKNIKINDILD